MSIVLMRILESAPSRYDRGIRWLTLGQAARAYDRLTAHIRPGWRVLDIGTGTGALALRAAARGAEVVAVDVNPAMLEIGRRKAEAAGLAGRIAWREMGAAELDALPDGSFDAICSGLCLSELTPDERRYALAQARRLLRPGGLLLLADEVRPRRPLRRLLHALLRAPLAVLTWLSTQTTTHAVPDLVGLVAGAGFDVVEVQRNRLGSWAEVVARRPEHHGDAETRRYSSRSRLQRDDKAAGLEQGVRTGGDMKYLLTWLLTTAFRFLPWPTRTGLRAVGRPGPDSPVLLTCNFALTVARVERAMKGMDAWLLVANSHGINVWCAAAGGHLTTHSVISALKTTPIADRVAHRRAILPQLAAVGIEADQVRERTGWEVAWGPADARDLPAFLRGEETPQMRQVRFDALHRLEMAVMWAAPLSLLALVALPFWPADVPGLVALIWGLSLAVYLDFPLYEPLVARGSLGGFLLLFGGLAVGGAVLIGALTGQLDLPFLLRWGGAGLGVALLIALDMAGTTPLYKSWTHVERRYRVALEVERCVGCGRCAQVCPRGVFAVAEVASQPHADRCERCGACIVQCPTDALAFATPDGERIPPEVVRRYKLNMMGRRSVE